MRLLPSYFIHHRKDDDTPYEVGGATLLLAVLAFGIFGLAAGDAYLLRQGGLAAVITSSLVELANGDRAAGGVGELRVSPTLTAVAQAKANDMAAKGYFAHTSPEGHSPWYWFTQGGYDYSYAGENLAVDFTDSATVEAAWMASPGHRANLLNGHYTEIGIAIAHGTYNGHPTIFVVQEFGAPAQTAFADAAPAVPMATSSPLAIVGDTGAPTVAGEEAPAPTSSPVVATSTPTPAAVAEPPPAEPPAELSWWQRLVVSPRTVFGYAYYVLAVLVLLLFAYVTELELHKRHLRHAAEAGALLVLLFGLFIVADYLIFAQPVLAAL